MSSNKLHVKPLRKGENRLLWGIPLTEHLFSTVFRKWPDYRINPDRLMTMGGIYLPDAHNKMIEWALARRDWDALVWLEHDHTFHPQLVDHLGLLPAEVNVAGMLYFGRNALEPFPMAGMWNPVLAHAATKPNALGECDVCGRDVKAAGQAHPAMPWNMRYLQPSQLIPMLNDQGLYEVDFIPSGLTFIRREVLENWPRDQMPWYRTIEDTDEQAGAGDDIRFAKLAQRQGHKIYLDTWAPVDDTGRHHDVRHITAFELGRDYYWDRIKLAHYQLQDRLRAEKEADENGHMAKINHGATRAFPPVVK